MAISGFVDRVSREEDANIAQLADAAVGFAGNLANASRAGMDARDEAYTLALAEQMKQPDYSQRKAAFLFKAVREDVPEQYKNKSIAELLDMEGGEKIVFAQYEKMRKEATYGGLFNEITLSDRGRKVRDLMDDRMKLRGVQDTLEASVRIDQRVQGILDEYKAWQIDNEQSGKALSGEQAATKQKYEEQLATARQQMGNIAKFARNYITDPNEYQKIVSNITERALLMENTTTNEEEFNKNSRQKIKDWLTDLGLDMDERRIEGVISSTLAKVNNDKRVIQNGNTQILKDALDSVADNPTVLETMQSEYTAIVSNKSLTDKQKQIAAIKMVSKYTGKPLTFNQGFNDGDVVPYLSVVGFLLNPTASQGSSYFLDTKPVTTNLQSGMALQRNTIFPLGKQTAVDAIQTGRLVSEVVEELVPLNLDNGTLTRSGRANLIKGVRQQLIQALTTEGNPYGITDPAIANEYIDNIMTNVVTPSILSWQLGIKRPQDLDEKVAAVGDSIQDTAATYWKNAATARAEETKELLAATNSLIESRSKRLDGINEKEANKQKRLPYRLDRDLVPNVKNAVNIIASQLDPTEQTNLANVLLSVTGDAILATPGVLESKGDLTGVGEEVVNGFVNAFRGLSTLPLTDGTVPMTTENKAVLDNAAVQIGKLINHLQTVAPSSTSAKYISTFEQIQRKIGITIQAFNESPEYQALEVAEAAAKNSTAYPYNQLPAIQQQVRSTPLFNW